MVITVARLTPPLRFARVLGMPYYRVTRMSFGIVLARVVLALFLGIAGLVCIANRAWFEGQAMNAIYGDGARIHLGSSFQPGASAIEDGVRQTAVLIGGKPHIKVISPSALWHAHHPDAVCTRNVCTAAATSKTFVRAAGGLGSVLGVLLFGYIIWVVVAGDMPRRRW